MYGRRARCSSVSADPAPRPDRAPRTIFLLPSLAGREEIVAEMSHDSCEFCSNHIRRCEVCFQLPIQKPQPLFSPMSVTKSLAARMPEAVKRSKPPPLASQIRRTACKQNPFSEACCRTNLVRFYLPNSVRPVSIDRLKSARPISTIIRPNSEGLMQQRQIGLIQQNYNKFLLLTGF